ncbi:tail tube [Vibrio phage D479]
MFSVRQFVAKMDQDDVARSNLYLVAFPSLENYINNNGVVGSPQGTLDQVDGWFKAADSALKTASEVRSQFGALKRTGIKGVLNGDASSMVADYFGADPTREAKLAMMAKGANLPGRTLEVESDYQRRKTQKVVKGKDSGTVTMQFYLSPGHEERQIMLAWQKSIFSSTTCQVAFAAEYEKSIEIITLKRNGDPATVTSLSKAFPMRIGDVELSYENNNEVSTFEVEFTFSTFNYVNAISEEMASIIKGNTFDQIADANTDFGSKYNASLGALNGIGL